MNRRDLAAALHLDSESRRQLRTALRSLEKDGGIVRLRGNRWARPDAARTLNGLLQVHRLGYGTVRTGGESAQEIHITREDLNGALNGDEVQVEVRSSPARPASRGRRMHPAATRGGVPPTALAESGRGRVVRVLRREKNTIVGLLKKTAYYDYVIPLDPSYPVNVRVDGYAGDAGNGKDGELAVLTLADWLPRSPAAHGTVREIIGPPDGPGADMIALLRQHQLSVDFPAPVDRQARTASADDAVRNELGRRRDLRDQLTLTIDPVDARDFDDAVSLQGRPDGGWLLGVHIADVSHYVTPGSDIDREAAARGTTVYLVDRAVMMLPPYLTTEVCSLRPGVDRLSHSVLLRLSAHGDVESAETFPSIIRSRVRLTYEQVQATYAGPSDGIAPDVSAMLAGMRGLAAQLRARRMAAGALDFDLPEVRCDLDDQGRVTAIRPRGSLEAYHLIEEFMLLANQAVARRLREARGPALYRIHEKPDETQWAQMRTDLEALDLRLASPHRETINAIIATVRGTVREYPAALAVLRNLKRAVYSPACLPHFGLAFFPYTHFTSPIRRYPDLLVHRMLKAIEEGRPPPYPARDLERLAAHCSLREREADAAARESIEIKRIEYYRRLLETGETGPMTAVVTGEVSRGLLVEIPDTQQRGLLPFAHLRQGRGAWRMGDYLQVEVSRVDVARRWVDFRPAAAARDTAGAGGRAPRRAEQLKMRRATRGVQPGMPSGRNRRPRRKTRR